ncbi:MAG: ATP-binding protein [Pseudonocardiales bacterium]
MLDELLEREAELAVLSTAVQRARCGAGALVLFEGPPGVGRSRLLRTASELAGNLTVLAARGTELESELPFGVARQLLGNAILSTVPGGSSGATPGLPELPEGECALVEHLHEALLNMVFPKAGSQGAGGARMPLLVLVDDAQWADRPSLRFLAHLAVRLEDLPIAVVVAVRTGEQGVPGDLLQTLRAAPVAGVWRPAPLSTGAVAAAVRSACGDVDDDMVQACARVSGGNPFYLGELIRELTTTGRAASAEAVADAAPDSVLRTTLIRLGKLGPNPTALAKAAAVFGDGAALGVVAELAELPVPDAEDAADTLATAGFLNPGEPLRFTHPLIASTLRADIGAFTLARAHHRAAQLLIHAGARPEEVAAHLLRSRPRADPNTVEQLRAAAALARARGAPETAAQLLERALDEPPPDHLRAAVLLELAEADALRGFPRAMAHLEQAIELLEDHRERVSALNTLSRLTHHAGDYARGAELARRGLAQLSPGDPFEQTLLAAFVGPALLHPPLRAELADRLAPLIEAAAAGTFPTEPALLAQLAIHVAATNGPAELARLLAQAAFAVDPLVDQDSQGGSVGFASAALIYVDALDVAEPLLDNAVRVAQQRGAVLAGSIAAHHRALVRYHLGRLDQAVADAERSLQTYRDDWAPSSWSTPILALCHLERGDLQAATEAIAIGERGDPSQAENALLLEARAAVALAEGDPARALADARAAGAQIQGDFGFVPARGFDWRRLGGLAAHHLGHHDEAQRLLSPALAELRAIHAPRQLGATLTTAGVVAGGTEGRTLLMEAVSVLERSPARLEYAHALHELGAAHRRCGELTEAQAPLYRALELADQFNAVPLATRIREELNAMGLRPRRAARSGIAALTASERRVADRAAQGLSNPQIAHQLHVTRKTVESHLAHVYRKLEIPGRSHLAAALTKTG